MYDDLVYATPGLKPQDIPKYFKDGSFGVKPDDVERTYHPRADVTVVRDRGFGVPHVYGATRSAAMFGLGYVGVLFPSTASWKSTRPVLTALRSMLSWVAVAALCAMVSPPCSLIARSPSVPS